MRISGATPNGHFRGGVKYKTLIKQTEMTKMEISNASKGSNPDLGGASGGPRGWGGTLGGTFLKLLKTFKNF